MCPHVLLDETCPIPISHWTRDLYNPDQWKSPKGQKLFHILFAAYIPDLEKQAYKEKIVDCMMQYAKRYPATIGIINNEGNGGAILGKQQEFGGYFCTKFASLFIVFRRMMYENLVDKYQSTS